MKQEETMQTVLIDTDIAIDYLKGKKQAYNVVRNVIKNRLAHMSVLSTYELFAGMRAHEEELTRRFIGACIIDNVNLEISNYAGNLYKEYRKKGITLTAIDCINFATAVINDHKILTNNIKHYPDHNILYVCN